MPKHMLQPYFFRNTNQMLNLVGKLFHMRRQISDSRPVMSKLFKQGGVGRWWDSTKLICYRKGTNEAVDIFGEA